MIMKKIILALIITSLNAIAQVTVNLPLTVSGNDVELLKSVVADYNSRLITTNTVISYKTNLIDGVEQVIPISTNIVVVTNGTLLDVRTFYTQKIIPLVQQYHDLLLRQTIQDFLKKQEQDNIQKLPDVYLRASDSERAAIKDLIKKYGKQ